MRGVVFHARRRGISLVECVILVVVLMIAVGAVFSTLGMAQRTYTFHIQDKRAREVLFAWHQTFESMWPPSENFYKDTSGWQNQANAVIESTSEAMGFDLIGPSTTSPRPARVGGLEIEAEAVALDRRRGRLDLDITVKMGSGKIIVNRVRRSYNIFSHETVSDDLS